MSCVSSGWFVRHQSQSQLKILNFQEDPGSYLVLIYWDVYPIVVMDYYSRYVEVEIMRKTTTDKIVKSLHKMFQTHRLPIQIVTDNGHQFLNAEFKDFMEQQDIEHRRVIPLQPQANGEVERQNRLRLILKQMKIAQEEKRYWRDELSD